MQPYTDYGHHDKAKRNRNYETGNLVFYLIKLHISQFNYKRLHETVKSITQRHYAGITVQTTSCNR